MSNLENFIRQNKSSFEDVEPSDALWARLEKRLDAPKPAKVVPLKSIKWMAAAAAVIIVATSAWFMLKQNPEKNQGPQLAVTDTSIPRNITTDDTFMVRGNGMDTTPQLVKNDVEPNIEPDFEEPTGVYSASVAEKYYKDIKEKHNMLAVLKKDEPLLYDQFNYDWYVLDSTYQVLKMISKKPNADKERIMEAMLSNLQMQTDLLQKQLKIVKTIKTKKENDSIKYSL